jgi:VanZ family protein
MGMIFFLSSQPSENLPNFNLLDRAVKKGGHMIGFGLLAVSYLHALGTERKRYWLAWTFAILYAMTDEIHQSFVPGRGPSIWDVVIYDNLGALIALGWVNWRGGVGAKNRRDAL